jgi:hypothetical protein
MMSNCTRSLTPFTLVKKEGRDYSSVMEKIRRIDHESS